MNKLSLHLMFLAAAIAAAAAADQAGQVVAYPRLAEPVLVMGVTDDGFRPLHLSIYGRYAAIIAAKNGAT